MHNSLKDICITKVVNNIEIISEYNQDINISTVANQLHQNLYYKFDDFWVKFVLNHNINYLKFVKIQILPILFVNKNEKIKFDKFLNVFIKKICASLCIDYKLSNFDSNNYNKICNQIAYFTKYANYLKSYTFKFTDNYNSNFISQLLNSLNNIDINKLNLKKFSFYYYFNKYYNKYSQIDVIYCFNKYIFLGKY